VERFWIACAALVAVAACNPTSLKPGYCHTNKDCTMGKTCNPKTLMCWDMDASSDADAQGDGKDGGDAKDAEVAPPPRCPQTINCADGGYDGSAGVCEPDAGMCVECLEDGDCTSKPKTPICDQPGLPRLQSRLRMQEWPRRSVCSTRTAIAPPTTKRSTRREQDRMPLGAQSNGRHFSRALLQASGSAVRYWQPPTSPRPRSGDVGNTLIQNISGAQISIVGPGTRITARSGRRD
jgi:hypothetical protein